MLKAGDAPLLDWRSMLASPRAIFWELVWVSGVPLELELILAVVCPADVLHSPISGSCVLALPF